MLITARKGKKKKKRSPVELKCIMIYLDMCRLGAESILNSVGEPANAVLI